MFITVLLIIEKKKARNNQSTDKKIDTLSVSSVTSLSSTISRSLSKLLSIELVMPSNHLILCCPLLFLPPIPPSIRVFSNESSLRMRWPKYWSFSFSIIPSKEHPGLISFRMDWLDLAVHGPLKSPLQHHSSKAEMAIKCIKISKDGFAQEKFGSVCKEVMFDLDLEK